MGKIEKLDFEKIVPTQYFLKEDKIKRFYSNYFEDPRDLIVPVRRLGPKDFLLDGHHSLSTLELMGDFVQGDLYVWLAEDEWDFMGSLPKNFHQTKLENRFKSENIHHRYHEVLEFDATGTLRDLRLNYDFMSNPQTFMDFILRR